MSQKKRKKRGLQQREKENPQADVIKTKMYVRFRTEEQKEEWEKKEKCH